MVVGGIHRTGHIMAPCSCPEDQGAATPDENGLSTSHLTLFCSIPLLFFSPPSVQFFSEPPASWRIYALARHRELLADLLQRVILVHADPAREQQFRGDPFLLGQGSRYL